MLHATVSPNSSDPFHHAGSATKNILLHAFFLFKQKQNLPSFEYKKLLKDNGWEKEDAKYRKIALLFEDFSIEELSAIEPETLFLLAKYKKYAPAIAKLKLGEISQSRVRELMSDCNKNVEPQTNTNKSDTKKVKVVSDNTEQTAESEIILTELQLQERIDKAIAEYEIQMKEKRIAEYEQIQRSALQAADEELQAARDRAEQLARANQELQHKIASMQQNLASVNNVAAENKQLIQRVESLEYTLMMAEESSRNNTFSKQAEKVINKELALTIEPLSKGLEEKEAEVAKLKAVVKKQRKELTALHDKSEQINSLFASVAEERDWLGWSNGYRDRGGMLWKGLDAIEAFLKDLLSQSSQVELAWS